MCVVECVCVDECVLCVGECLFDLVVVGVD